MSDFSDPTSYRWLRAQFLFLRIQQVLRSMCDVFGLGQSALPRICAALIVNAIISLGILLLASLLRIPPGTGVVLALSLFAGILFPFAALVLFRTDADLAARRAELEQRLPAARAAWEAYKAKLRADREARKREELARQQAELARKQRENEAARSRQEFAFELPAGSPKRSTHWLSGNGSFSLEVVGESRYQRELERICGGRTEQGVNRVVHACLMLEDDNPHDQNAVCVQIDNLTVGYLSREDAKTFRMRLWQERIQGAVFPCEANIRGGWDRGPRDRGHFGVWLDVTLD